EMWLLARLSGRRFFDVFYVPTSATTTTGTTPKQSIRQHPLWGACGLLCAGALAILVNSGRTEIIPDRTQFVSFPTHMGQWQGHFASLDKDTEQFLKVDDYILADYSGPDGRTINFYVAYYASQRANESP